MDDFRLQHWRLGYCGGFLKKEDAMSTRVTKYAALIMLCLVCAVAICGCARHTYVTPGASVNLQVISEYDIQERFQTKAASPFPARIAVVRVQDPYYRSYTSHGYGKGRFSVAMARDVEGDEGFERLAALPQVAGIATVNRLLLPENLESVKDLRLAAASLHADMLLVYTFDTAFNVKGRDLGPLTVITLGFLPSKKAFVTTTASAVLYDVRTGHVYGLAEASSKTSHIASTWSTEQVVDNARVETEKEAFTALVDAFARTWDGVLKEYAGGDT
jgi:hypothetical protein